MICKCKGLRYEPPVDNWSESLYYNYYIRTTSLISFIIICRAQLSSCRHWNPLAILSLGSPVATKNLSIRFVSVINVKWRPLSVKMGWCVGVDWIIMRHATSKGSIKSIRISIKYWNSNILLSIALTSKATASMWLEDMQPRPEILTTTKDSL